MPRSKRPTTDPVCLRFRELSEGQGLSQEEAAAKIPRCTVTEWGHYESWKRPGWERLQAICEAFDVSPTWLMFGIGPKELRLGDTILERTLARFVQEAKDRDVPERVMREITTLTQRILAHVQRRQKSQKGARTGRPEDTGETSSQDSDHSENSPTKRRKASE